MLVSKQEGTDVQHGTKSIEICT